MQRSVTGLLKAASLALSLLALPAFAQQEPVRLSPQEARGFAMTLLRQDRPAAARAIALGLLKKDSRDFVALMVLADSEKKLGRPVQAKFAARRAFRTAKRDKDRFTAAYIMSGILKAEGKFQQSQLWLRRAGQATDEERLQNAARGEFRRVRALNPWTLTFGLTVTPTSNVNGGPNDNTYTIGDFVFVDDTAVPLSGFEIGARFGVKRRFKPQDWGQVSFSLNYDERQYVLSDSAKASQPSARGSDYAFRSLQGNLSFDFTHKNKAASSSFDVTLGHHWQKEESLSSYYKLRYGRQNTLSDIARIGYGVSYENQSRKDTAARSTESFGLDGFWLKKMPSGDYLRLGFNLAKVDSASSDMAHTAYGFSTGYVRAKPFLKSRLTLGASLHMREYDRLRYASYGVRRDKKLSLSADMLFTEIDYLGFSPSITLRATRNLSNVTLFDSQEFGISFGVKSTF
ncbi:DUF560 domain-containing protein [Lentibacter algarum]|uniref:tetratricopeptide repeat protein n=1 Tax=Lentibacter algarum TaxID=576131 RepID=UPI001C0A24BC|nr:surface lipoprotein assembly modifier [Lentibacter algarum]MBU2983219.1 DUF560 domain-containing protein [Lentibacter algarum]